MQAGAEARDRAERHGGKMQWLEVDSQQRTGPVLTRLASGAKHASPLPGERQGHDGMFGPWVATT